MQNSFGMVHCANTVCETDSIQTGFAMVVSRLFTTVMPPFSVPWDEELRNQRWYLVNPVVKLLLRIVTLQRPLQNHHIQKVKQLELAHFPPACDVWRAGECETLYHQTIINSCRIIVIESKYRSTCSKKTVETNAIKTERSWW